MSSELWVAVIAAGSAVAGAAVGGWFARSAGLHQAAATRDTVQATLDEQRKARVVERRRQAYIDFLDAADALTREPNDPTLQAASARALTQVTIEGPLPVILAAQEVASTVRQQEQLDDLVGTLLLVRRRYLAAVHEALGIEGIANSSPE
ncbi:hypothetical protein ABZ784_03400 [Streptomyces tendae]|uniref:hypothetical protein n=1 Tax=Streptomyces tendae TaxID=1932 RepID=UPI0033F8C76C